MWVESCWWGLGRFFFWFGWLVVRLVERLLGLCLLEMKGLKLEEEEEEEDGGVLLGLKGGVY